jgi:hypothetical protein
VLRLRYHTRKRRFNLTSRRLREIENLIRYRNTISGSSCMSAKAGEIYLPTAARHLRRLREDSGRPTSHAELLEALRFWASSWLPQNAEDAPESLERAVNSALRHPRTEKAEALGRKLKVTDAERAHLKIRTIAPYNVSPLERDQRRKQKKRDRDKLRAESKRRARGIKPRAEYLANSLSARAPWKDEGITRRSWERRRKRDRGMSQVHRPIE